MRHDDRIAELRKRVLQRKQSTGPLYMTPDPVVRARSLQASEGLASWQVRRGLLVRDVLSSVDFEIDDLEPLVGRIPRRHASTDAERTEAKAYLAAYQGAGGQTGHCELDLSRVMAGGMDGLAADLSEQLVDAEEDQAEAYHSFLLALEGLLTMIERAAACVADAALDAGPSRKAELDSMASTCRRIAHQAPVTFRDALQLTWFATFAVQHADSAGLVVPGRLDRLLAPYYEEDLAKSRLTRGEALLLIESFYLLVNDYVPDGLAVSVMVGGRDASDRDVTNELSYLCLEAIRRTGLIYPTVGVCWHEGTPPELTRLAIDIMGEGYATPAFFGDETIQTGLGQLGVPPEDACYYVNSTCVEITPCGASNIWVASPYFSTCGILLEELADQSGNEAPSATFEDFFAAYCSRLGGRIAEAVEAQNTLREQRRLYGRKPLQSVFTRDCITRGRDIDDGGARYNWVECSFVGLANLTDSLHVVREEVFGKKRLSLAMLKAILDVNFEGHEAEHHRFLDGLPKYGQDCPEVDALYGRLVEFVRGECAKHGVQPNNAAFVPGAFCWVMHERLGRECGATPDGRRAGFPFADGCGPAQGREKLGPTAAILSTTSWDHSPMIGGLAYNMKFNSSFFEDPRGYDLLEDLVLTFLKRGGFETQVNVVDARVLREAREHPDEHRDLVVRIGGYCDYFTRLTPEMQDEIILRTEFTTV